MAWVSSPSSELLCSTAYYQGDQLRENLTDGTRGDRRDMRLYTAPQRKKPPPTLRLTTKDNIKMNLKETWSDVLDYIPVAQDRIQWLGFVNSVMNNRVPYKQKFHLQNEVLQSRH
jgi:hypothetical protein